ncbi:phosphoglycerate dehydrogenase [Enterococcus sp. BWR-S5]|uniref:phosphoglycerate dehydrogenase n=1 Tax=Enterococcus sp. BWR-S5 TaxID=2787714 RepID=UPI0019207A74|nr:phosphoglycerate dehydrogenase [Enterococcus sp. BWR-S5]MBL1224750.1 phosphoglycerate dehydrogenase [Enterococcus sp. BWR-S5]
MAKPIILLQEHFKPEQIERIKAAANDYEVIDAADPSQNYREEDIVIMLGWNKKHDPKLLENPNSKLKWVQSISAGVDSYDLAAFKKRDILLSNGSGIHTISITEHVLGVLLAKYRGILQAAVAQQDKQWKDSSITYQQLSEQSMLIVGTGNIGQQLASFAQGLKIRTYGINSSGHPSPGFLECYSQKNMSRVIKDMDIVVNILPLTDETYYLYNEEMFHAMKKGSVFINVGRGRSVKTDDLIQALENGQISFAALDVFEEEPLSQDSPLWTMENVLITPHISGMTDGFKEKLLSIFLTNLESFITEAQLTRNQVNLDRGY